MNCRTQVEQSLRRPPGILKQRISRIDTQLFFQPVDQALQVTRHRRQLLAERFGLGCGDIVVSSHARGVAGEWPKLQGTGNHPRSSGVLPRGGPRQSSQLTRIALIKARQMTGVGDNKSRNRDEIRRANHETRPAGNP
jgi:hypothetical protein